MDRTGTHKRYQRSNSEQLEVNGKLFIVVRKRNISVKEKLKKIKKILGKRPQPDINAQDGNDNFNTALHLAIKRNELEVVNFLLSEGADTTVENGDGKTALQLAEECNHVEIIDKLQSCISPVELPHSEEDRLASDNSQPVAANPNQAPVFHSNSHAALTSKPTASTVLPPFSGKLRIDKELKLSNDDFKQAIEKFYVNKQLSPIDQLKATPPYPTPYMLAQFASMAYADYQHAEPKPPDDWQLLTTASHFGITNGYFGTAYWHPKHQQVVIAHRGTDIRNFGALVTDFKGILFNNYVDQMSSASSFANKVVAVLQEIEQEMKVSFELFFTGHSLGGWLAQITTFTTEYLEERRAIFLKKVQIEEHKPIPSSTVQKSNDVQDVCLAQDTTFAFKNVKDNAGTLVKKKRREEHEPLASSTVREGHDIRKGSLANVTALNTKRFKGIGGTFHKKLKTEEHETLASSTVQDSHDAKQCYHPHTVVFDSPGCKDMLSQMADKLDVRLHASSIDLQHLDITSYLSAPNRINTCNSHLGTVYRIFTDLSDMGWKEKHTPLYNLATHSMDKIVQAFAPKKGKENDVKLEPEILEVVDWPVSTSLTGDAEYNDFFKLAEQLNDYHVDVMDTVHSEVHKGYNPLRYQTKAYNKLRQSLSIFTQDEREFLERYRWLSHVPEFFQLQDLFSELNNAETKTEAEQKLQDFNLENEYIRCQDINTLRGLIPFVKRLVRLFPQLKDKAKYQLSSLQIRKRVYQYETQHNVQKIDESALDFNPGALGLREFIESDQQIWQLRMIDGDAWIGLTKVYRVLQNTSCTPCCFSEGNYTILELQRLLTVNRMINFNALLKSELDKPHLLIIACGNSQTDNDELEKIFKEMFSILKQNKNMKIILTAQSEDSKLGFLQQIASKTLGNEIKTTEQELRWNELTDGSKSKMFKKKVNFQGVIVPLSEISSAESMTNSFRLADLLQEKELRIGKELVTSARSSYNEKYYFDRTFNHNIVIRQDIVIDKREGKFADLLASTEREFKQLCQQNPATKVHWLVKDKSGELFWQQSRGNLSIIRKYIDAHKFHCYTPSDLDKLLEQAKKQMVMLITDEAGMGKSTILTHLSKRIKQKNPANWLARIDLNDYTKLLKDQKGKKIDKVWVLEFVSKEVLKLESHLEKELFKKSFEGNGISKVVVMVDGFDEISPSHKETVLDMLQVLKQTKLEQLWVTTRPHLKEDLENNLQQLSYTLQLFSEEEQVEFLKKFWRENLNLEGKDQDRLQIYAEALIRKLAQSISDKDKEFTGIPLQTRMLAEAFKEEFISFYLSEKSEPEQTQKLDLLGLYRQFIDSKYNIYYEEKCKIPAGNEGIERVRQNIFEQLQTQHELLALEALFTEDQVTFLAIGHHSTFSDETLAGIGIVQRNSEGKPQFIHRTFAEYNVAEFLIKQLTKNTKQHEQVQEFILNVVLIKEDCKVIRAFIDGLLKKSEPTNQTLRQNGENLYGLRYNKKKHTFLKGVKVALLEAAKEGNVRIIEFLRGSTKSGESLSTVTKLLLAKDNKGRSAWHKAAEESHVEVLDKLWEWAKKIQQTPGMFRYEVVLLKDERGETAWNRAARRGQVEILEKLWEWAKEMQLKQGEIKNKLLLSEDRYDKTAWIMAAQRGQVEILEKLWDWAKELQLKPEEIRTEVLLSKDGMEETAWHKAAGGGLVEILEKLWDWAKELQLTPEQLRNELLLSKALFRITAWTKAADKGKFEILERLWGWAKELQLKPEELRNELLLSRCEYNETAWHKAAYIGDVQVLEKLWDWAKELQLKPEELRNEVLLSKCNSKITAWHKAAISGHKQLLEKLWDLAKQLQLKPEELRNELLLSTDMNNETGWHTAAKIGYLGVLEAMWDWAKELQLKPEDLRNELLLSKYKSNETAWHKAAERGQVETLQKLWDWAKELQLKPEELRNELLSKDESNETAWHKAAKQGQVEILEILWDWAKELQLKPEELRNELLLSKDKSNNTAWHKAAARGQVEILQKLWDWAKELQLKPEELRNELLLSKDESNETAWHNAAKQGQVEILEILWDCAKELQLKPEELRNELLLSKDESKETAWYKAVTYGQVEMLEKLLDWAKELQLKPEELRNELFLSKRDFHRKVLHNGREINMVKILVILRDWAKKLQLKPEELRNVLLLSKDDSNESVWQEALVSGRVKILKILWDWAKELQLKPEELRNELFLSKDEFHRTNWHRAANAGNLKQLEILWDWAKELQIKTDELRNELLLSKDNYNETAWDKAILIGDVEILVKLWDWAKELQLKPEELRNELFLSKDECNQTAWHKAASSGQVEILEILWDWAKELQLNPEELRNELFLSTDESNTTAWQMAANGGQVEILEILWDWAKELQVKPEKLRNDLLLSKYESNEWAWQLVVARGQVEILEILWDWAKELQIKPEELRNELLLSQEDLLKIFW